jgi:uncharacterized phage protein (TIGR02218 family)
VKTLNPNLLAHYQQGTTTMVACWKITRTDGQVFGFTEYDKNLMIEGLLYLAKSGFSPTDVDTQSKLAVDNLNANGILDSDVITQEELATGKWDFAAVEIFKVNANSVIDGRDVLVVGRLGEVKLGRVGFEAEVRGLANAYAQSHNLIYQPGCRATLGDAQCKVDLTPFTFTGTLDGVAPNGLTVFDAGRTETDGFFDFGNIRMTSGKSNGLLMEIKQYSVGQMVLQLEFASGVDVGDTYIIQVGCGKRFQEDCVGRFNNGVNFRGEPHLPGMDKFMLFGGQK